MKCVSKIDRHVDCWAHQHEQRYVYLKRILSYDLLYIDRISLLELQLVACVDPLSLYVYSCRGWFLISSSLN